MNCITVKEAAGLLRRSPRAILRAIKRGKIPAEQYGGKEYLIPQAWIDQQLEIRIQNLREAN